MALDFWSPIFLLMQATDGGMDVKKATKLVRGHVLSFGTAHVRSDDE